MAEAPEQAKQTEKGPNKQDLRNVVQIARRIGQSRLKIIPSDSWSVHYKNPALRESILNKVLSGERNPQDIIIEDIQPEGFTYNLHDLQEGGTDALIGRVRGTKDYLEGFDYKGYLDFLHGLQGKDIDLKTATELFEGISRSQIEEEALKRYGDLGRKQIKEGLKKEAEEIIEKGKDEKRLRKILDRLRLKWMRDKKIIADDKLEEFDEELEDNLREVADELEDAYLKYVKEGNEEAKEGLVKKVGEQVKKIVKQKREDQLDDFIEEALNEPENLPPDLQNELDNIFNDYTPPQNDIPPPFDETFSPSMDPMKQGAEKQKVVPLFSVRPPIGGLYQGPVYSEFDQNNVEWKLKPSLTQVNTKKLKKAPKSGTHVIEGKVAPGTLTPLFIPRGYSVFQSTLPRGLELHQDEKGTYYLKNTGSNLAEFEVNFAKDKSSASNMPPLPSDTEDIGSQALSNATKRYLASLKGKSNVEKAVAIVHYMKNILKLEYSNDPKYNRVYKQSPAKYFSQIEHHKQVDCDVAATYFIALCRAAGVPSRFIMGHSVDLVQNGKAVLHRGSGHAWTEIYDEQAKKWKTIDATPEDTRPREQQEQDEDQEKINREEDADIEAPKQDPRDEEEPPKPEEVEKKVEDQAEKMKKGEDDEIKAEEMPEKMREKMEKLKEKREQRKKDKSQKSERDSSDSDSSDSDSSDSDSSDSDSSDSDSSDSEWDEAKKQMEEMMRQDQEMRDKAQEMKDKTRDAKSLKELKDLKDKIDDEKDDMYEEDKKDLEEMLEAQEEAKKKALEDKIKEMQKDGFLDDEDAKKLLEEIQKDDTDLEKLAQIEQDLSRESTLYDEYIEIRNEVMPLVKKWLDYFVKRLPKVENPDFDEEILARSGMAAFAHEVQPIDLVLGKTNHPMSEQTSTQPKFMASLLLDISGSMEDRLRDARKLLVFWSELFAEITGRYGYIRFSIAVFDDVTEVVKDFGHRYNSKNRYTYEDGRRTTVKVRMMEKTMARGGTNMGDAVWHANHSLNAELQRVRDRYMSSITVFSDGDTLNGLQGDHLRKFIAGQEQAYGEWWGHKGKQHMKAAYLIGPQSQKATLAKYFGDENSDAHPDMNELITRAMKRFDRDSQFFCKKMGLKGR